MSLGLIYKFAHLVHCESFDSLQRVDGGWGSFLVSWEEERSSLKTKMLTMMMMMIITNILPGRPISVLNIVHASNFDIFLSLVILNKFSQID